MTLCYSTLLYNNKYISLKMATDARAASYLNHLAYIDDKKPPPKQVQYMNYTHSVAWSFSKDEKCKSIHIKICF